MPIWSLTNERLEKLKNQIAAKKAEYDELESLSEKDLWVKDLDEFVQEWHTQLKLEEEITTGIRRMGRRVSSKIGAGKGRRPKDDDEYQPEKKTKAKAPKAEKVETKSHERFTEKFQAASKPKPKNDLSDDDFALLGKNAVVKQESEPPASLPDATSGRSKRAAATKAKYALSDSDDDDFMDLDEPEVKDESGSSEEKEVAAEKPAKRIKSEVIDLDDELNEPASDATAEKPAKGAAKKAKPSYADDDFGESDSEEVVEKPAKRAATKAKSSYADDDFGESGSEEEVVEKPSKRTATKAKSTSVDNESDQSASEEVAEKPTRRAAAKAKRSYVDDDFGSTDDDDNGDDMLGDVGSMVKGIGAPATNNGRLSLFSMSRPDAGDAPIPKLKSKQSRSILETDDHDDTNYEALAMSSPRKPTKSDDLDDFLSDDNLPAATKPAAKSAAVASKAKAPLSVVPAAGAKKRGRPAGSKNKPKGDDASAHKTAKTIASRPKTLNTLSPAAKAYAAKKAKSSKKAASDDDDEDELMGDAAPASPKPASKRPGRAAAAKAKAKSIYLDDDDDDDDSFVSADDGSGGSGGRGRKRKGKKDDDDAFDMDEDSD